MSHRPLQSSLARHVASGPSGDADAHAACKAAWHRDGVFCIRLDQIKGWGKRIQVEQIATEIYGRRKGE